MVYSWYDGSCTETARAETRRGSKLVIDMRSRRRQLTMPEPSYTVTAFRNGRPGEPTLPVNMSRLANSEEPMPCSRRLQPGAFGNLTAEFKDCDFPAPH
ncbi:hypothetical protein CHU98_g8047 [Xylaria longipes]|nr:hypothetical protein CHU98_g8047 [Xylaria longipes]